MADSHYKKNNNRIPKSASAKSLMVLPDALPKDIDYRYYEVEAEKLLILFSTIVG